MGQYLVLLLLLLLGEIFLPLFLHPELSGHFKHPLMVLHRLHLGRKGASRASERRKPSEGSCVSQVRAMLLSCPQGSEELSSPQASRSLEVLEACLEKVAFPPGRHRMPSPDSQLVNLNACLHSWVKPDSHSAHLLASSGVPLASSAGLSPLPLW